VSAPGERSPDGSPAPTLIRFGAAMLLGLAVAVGHLGWNCRVPDSEACVWGKSLAIISIPVETGVFGFLIFGALTLVAWRRRASRGG
jgi:hypothetical protein